MKFNKLIPELTVSGINTTKKIIQKYLDLKLNMNE